MVGLSEKSVKSAEPSTLWLRLWLLLHWQVLPSKMCFQSSQRWQGLGRGSWPQFHQEKRVGSWPVLGWLKNPTETLRPFCISETTRVTSKKTVTNLKHRHSQLIMISVVKFNIELSSISHALFSAASCVSSCCQASFDHWLFQRVGHLEPTRPAECAKI